ncbi:lactonase family protein [Flavihumibacter sp. R14]|nr:lactonase family protein [Flavihumibacter soli]
MVTAQKTKTAKSNLIIGTYTQPGKSEGLYVYEFNPESGELSYKAKAAGITNPSYLAITKDQKFVYAVNETGRNNPGGVSSFKFDSKSGDLQFLNKVKSMGDDPCYISVDKKGKHIFVANYSGGNLSAFGIQPNGSLYDAMQVIQYNGSGADKSRQEKPHVHCTIISPDNKYLFAVDLGTDKVNSYKIRNGNYPNILQENQTPFTGVAPGSGPRHLTFHPNGKVAYLIHELTADVSVYQYEKGKLNPVQFISMLAPDFKGNVGAADIHVSPDGKFLYASNRGDANDIIVYSIDNDGKLSLTSRQSTLGKGPRNFAIDPSGRFLLVANQNSDEVVIFRRDQASGLLTDTGKRLQVGQPVCLKFAAVKL